MAGETLALRNQHMKRVVLFVVIVCAAILATGSAHAQDQDAIQSAAASMKQNLESLRQYAWQSRVNVSVDGEEKRVTLFQVRYNVDGELEKTAMGGEENQKKVRGPIRKNVAKKKKKQAHEFATEATQTIDAYMTPESIKKAMSQAFARKEDGMLKLRSEGVVKQGDSIELALVEATNQPMSFSIQSTVDESSISVEITFQKLDDGTNYPARTIVTTTFDGKPLKIETENFSYVKQGG